ncbi:MAG TPA: 50S ribosomal protein L19 [Candidatus Babeliales bacterium]|nr:50S ribosomal protein L19 [Candidatus Babeliales bacterium]
MKATFYTKETIRSIGMQNREYPAFGIGDMVVVSQSIKEAGKERLQAFQGNVIAMHKKGISSTFIVRKIADNSIAVERIFPFFSPLIKEIKVLSKGDVRRAKLYYLRKRIGKAAHVKQLVETKISIAKRKATLASE